MKSRIFIVLFFSFILFCCEKKHVDTEVAYIYDDNGRRVRLRNGDKHGGDILINQYDKDGNVTKIILTDKDGSKINEQEYSEDGSLVKTHMYRDSKLIGFTTYDGSGRKQSDNYVNPDNNQTTTFQYEYNGDKISKQTKKENDKDVYSQEFVYQDDKIAGVQVSQADGVRSYNFDENVIKETMSDAQGNILYQYENNAQNNSQKYIHFSEGKIDSVMECFVNDNRMREEKYKNDKIVAASESDFDGNKLKDEEYKNGKLVGYVEYIRENGKLVGRKTYSADNKVKRYYKYITKNGVTQVVTYDGNDNLIEYED